MKLLLSTACVIACFAVLVPSTAFAYEVALEDTDATPATGFKLPFKFKQQDSYALEGAMLIFCTAILINMYLGRRKNEKLAVRYVAELVRSDGVVQKQFAEAESQVILEGPDIFKFYATGRRYCQGALLTFRMASRQDLVSLLMKPGQRDTLDIEVNMNESAMPQTVLFIGTHSAAKTIIKDNRDISVLAKRMEPTRDRLATWPVDDLVVNAEQSAVFYEIISPQVMDALFGPNVWSEVGRYFKYLHVSSEYRVEMARESAVGATGRRSVVRVSLNLPPTGNWEILDRFITMVCLVIDGLGSCKLTPDQAKKASEARRKAENSREEAVSEKEKRLEERRLAKEVEERERLAKLPPDQREKERAKRDKVLKQRRMKAMVKKL